MQASACENEPILGSVRFGRWVHGLQPLRVTGPECAQSPLVHAVATVKIDRGPQCKNTKPGCNRKIQSQTRVVNGIAALVTTPLRLLVTRAPSGQASPAPGVRLSHGLRLKADAVIRAHIPAQPGSTGAAERCPALGTRVCGSRYRCGQGMWTRWTAMTCPGNACGHATTSEFTVSSKSGCGISRACLPGLQNSLAVTVDQFVGEILT